MITYEDEAICTTPTLSNVCWKFEYRQNVYKFNLENYQKGESFLWGGQKQIGKF